MIEEPGSGGSTLLQDISLYQRLQKSIVLNVIIDPSFYFTIEKFFALQSENFQILDAITNTERAQYHCNHTLHEISIQLKENRREIIGSISKYQCQNNTKEKPEVVIVFWSLNSLLINYQARDVLQFYYENVKEAIRYETTEFYLMQEGIVQETTTKSLMALSHAVWKFRRDKKRGTHQFVWDIVKMSNQDVYTSEIPYTIQQDKFVLINST